MYGLHQEIDRLTQILAVKDYKELFIKAVNRSDSFIGFMLIAIVVALGGIISVPVITTWIIQTAGAGSAFFGTAVNTARAGVRTGAAVVSSGYRLLPLVLPDDSSHHFVNPARPVRRAINFSTSIICLSKTSNQKSSWPLLSVSAVLLRRLLSAASRLLLLPG